MTMQLRNDQLRLIDGWQRNLPLVSRPYEEIGNRLGVDEARVIEMLSELARMGVLSRVGVTVRPNTVGASVLAAMRVPPQRLESIATVIGRERGVNHNYEREHEFNLWFVVTEADEAALSATLTRLRAATGMDVLELPLEKAYYLDLGFPTDMRGAAKLPTKENPSPPCAAPDTDDRRLLSELQDGLSLTPRPFDEIAQKMRALESDVIARLRRLISDGVVTRCGLIVHHRALGITANAMAVWDVPDAEVDRIGEDFASMPFVTLCYRRPRRMPDWRYNLFTMVHGRDRTTVETQIAELAGRIGVDFDRRATLFSRRCFIQRGARFEAA